MRLLILSFILVFSFCGSAQQVAEDTLINSAELAEKREKFFKYPPKASGWVNDFEDLFTPIQERDLDSIISINRAQTGIEIAIVTLDSNTVSDARFDELAYRLANTWKVGQKKKNNGILIAISKGHRRIRIANGYGIEKLISDEETKQVMDHYFISQYKKGKYFEGTYEGLLELIALLNKNTDKKGL